MSQLAILLTFSVGLTADAPRDEAARREVAFLEGEWAMIAAQRDGTVPPRIVMRGARRSARGNESTVIMQGRIYMKSTYTLDPSKSPKEIDYDVLEGEFRGQKQQGIYAIEGNTVRFCFASPGQPRPTDFTAPAGSGRSFSAWQKISGPPTADAGPTPAASDTYPTAAPQRFRLFSRFGNGGCCCRQRGLLR
jgi:uncharacterized protein (TIGR03067 family)